MVMDGILNLINIRKPQGKVAVFMTIFAGFIYVLVQLIDKMASIYSEDLEMILIALVIGLGIVCLSLTSALTHTDKDSNTGV